MFKRIVVFTLLMKKKPIEIRNVNKKIQLEVYSCNFLEKISGLMFSHRENAKALIFEFNHDTRIPIHSFFCPEFFAVWLDDKNKVIEVREVKSWKLNIKPMKNFVKLIEIPINDNYSKIIGVLCSRPR